MHRREPDRRPGARLGAGRALTPSPLDGSGPVTRSKRRQAAFGWFLFVYFLVSFSQGVYPPLLSELMSALGLSFAAAGLLGSAFGVARLALDLPAGLLIERIGATGLTHAGIGLILAGTVLTATASSLPALLLALSLIHI